MAIKIENSKTLVLWDESYPINDTIDSTFQFCAVAFADSLTGEAALTSPSAGGYAAGILKNPDATSGSPTVRGVVCVLGMTKARTSGTIEAGDLLMVNDSSGRLTTATSGCYVLARARNGATTYDSIIAVEVFPAFYLKDAFAS